MGALKYIVLAVAVLMYLLVILFPIPEFCLIQENAFDPVKEIFSHTVILSLVAETAAGLQVVQIVRAAFGKRNDVIDRVFLQRDEAPADTAVAFGPVVDQVALLLSEEAAPGQLCG